MYTFILGIISGIILEHCRSLVLSKQSSAKIKEKKEQDIFLRDFLLDYLKFKVAAKSKKSKYEVDYFKFENYWKLFSTGYLTDEDMSELQNRLADYIWEDEINREYDSKRTQQIKEYLAPENWNKVAERLDKLYADEYEYCAAFAPMLIKRKKTKSSAKSSNK